MVLIGTHLKNLTSLRIEGNNISNQGFIYICQNLPKLTKLLSNQCRITDEGFIQGAMALSNLEFLKISSNYITDDGIKEAGQYFKGLTDLVLLSCPNLTLEAVGSLLRSLPNLTMLRIEFCEKIFEEEVEQELSNVGHAHVSVFSCMPNIFEALFSLR